MPWTGFGSLKQDMDRLFDRMAANKWDDFPTLGDWSPSMDISETKDNLLVKVEVPGMDQKDIRISLQENLLTITGEKRQEKEEKDERYHRVERSYGVFTRGLRLPVAVDGEQGGRDVQERPADGNAAQDAGGEGHDHPDQERVAGPGGRGGDAPMLSEDRGITDALRLNDAFA